MTATGNTYAKIGSFGEEIACRIFPDGKMVRTTYDMLREDGTKVEIKTSTYREYLKFKGAGTHSYGKFRGWIFHTKAHQVKIAHFFLFVCLDAEARTLNRLFYIPAFLITGTELRISRNGKRWEEFRFTSSGFEIADELCQSGDVA